MTNQAEQIVRTKAQAQCPVCASNGVFIYQQIEDKLYTAPGQWSVKKCSNAQCALLWLDPMPITDDLSLLYDSYYTHQSPVAINSGSRSLYQKLVNTYISSRYGYQNKNTLWLSILSKLIYLHPERRASIDSSIMGLHYQQNNQLLEVGVGDGARLQLLDTLGWQVKGLDFDAGAVKVARGKGLDVALGDLFSQHYADNSFDVLISSHVLEHVPDPIAFLTECQRILKTGGRMVHYTPNADSYGHQHYKHHWRGLEIPRHLHLFTAQALTQAAYQSGFSTVQCNTTGRGANMLLDSHEMKYYGRLSSGVSLKKRWLFEFFSFKAFILSRINNRRAEELLIRAIK